VIEFRSLRQDELAAWFDHCTAVFSGKTNDLITQKLFIDHYYNDPNKDVEGILVACEDGKIVSTVKVIYRKAYFFHREISLGGISEVSTRPDYQGQGLATRLLNAAIQQMSDRHINLSMLRGTSGIYGKLGFVKAMTYSKIARVTGNNGQAFTMRPANLESDIPVLKAIYTEYSRKLSGAFARDDERYWKLWVKAEARNLWVVEDNLQVVAYVNFKYENACLCIDEFCSLSSHEEIFDQVVAKLCAVMGMEETEVRFESLIRSRLKADRLEKSEYNMFKLIHPFAEGNVVINSTEDLMRNLTDIAVENDELVSDILAWGIDGF